MNLDFTQLFTRYNSSFKKFNLILLTSSIDFVKSFSVDMGSVDVPPAAAAAAEVVHVTMAASVVKMATRAASVVKVATRAASVVNVATRTVAAAISIAQAATVGSSPVAVLVECLSEGTIVPESRMAEVALVPLAVCATYVATESIAEDMNAGPTVVAESPIAELTFALAGSAAASPCAFLAAAPESRSEPGTAEVNPEAGGSDSGANGFACCTTCGASVAPERHCAW